VNSSRTGDFFVATALGGWVGALWRRLYSCSGTIAPAGRIFHNHLTTSLGLLSSSDSSERFGSGTESKAATIGVRWPSGIVQTFMGVAADQILKIEGPQK
jgi:ASPIC/UnbV protein